MRLLPLLLLTTAVTAVEVTEVNYRGWRALRLANGVVEAILVPDIGRLMRFARPWDDNPLYENPRYFGQLVPEVPGDEWFNFGGDKVWPAEQKQWPAVMGRSWPPDRAFDGNRCRAEITPDGTVTLISGVSEHYQARIVRVFRLAETEARLKISQRLEKFPGPAREMTIWNVTQLRQPDAVYLPLPAQSAFPERFYRFGDPARMPANTKVVENCLVVTTDAEKASKYGLDHPTGWLAWVKNRTVFSQHYVYEPGGKYPDSGCCAEVFTADAAHDSYVELELLSPQRTLTDGQTITYDIEFRLRELPVDLPVEQVPATLREWFGG